MLNELLSHFYERDLGKLIEEVNTFEREEDLWRTQGDVRNSAGHLVLHIVGGMNHHIGANIARNGYIRNRNQEFNQPPVSRQELISKVKALIGIVNQTLNGLHPGQMEAQYPAFFDHEGTTISYVLIQLLAHLNYHLGQINYLRRQL